MVRRALAATRTLDTETPRGIYSRHDALRFVGSELDEVFGGAPFRQGMGDVDAFRFFEPSNFDLKGLGSDRTLYQLFWR